MSQFTGKERDAETQLDYFGARYYGSGLGRFTSPDWSQKPEPVPYADPSDPQSLNLYAYVRNNPLKNRDSDGHWCLFGLGTSCTPAPPKPPAPPAAPQMAPDGLPIAAATVRIGNSRSYRAAWQKANPGIKFPKDPATGQYMHADHDVAIADGGDPLDGNNITPRTAKNHMDRHVKNGDFKRWAARGKEGGTTPEEAPELPPMPAPPIPPELAPDPVPVPIGPGARPLPEEIPEIIIPPA